MKHFYEMFLTSGENWGKSSAMINLRSNNKKKKLGKYVWKRFIDLVAEQLGSIAACVPAG